MTQSKQRFIPSIPIGTIYEWYLPERPIPSGWFLCDGSHGTPDLRHLMKLSYGFPWRVLVPIQLQVKELRP